MLRPYFRFHRGLIKELCRIAHRCLAEFQRTTLGLPEGATGVVMAIHTFGEYLDFHPHLHALAADGLFVDSGLFHVMPDVSLAPLEELFRARVITFLVKKGILPPERARMLRGWTHSGFNVHRSQRVPPGNCEDIERLARAASTNWSGDSLSEGQPRRGGPLGQQMRIVALIDEAAVIERILRHIGLWEAGVRVDAARDPPEPVEPVIPPSPVGYGGQAEPWLDDPFPDYDHEPVFAHN